MSIGLFRFAKCMAFAFLFSSCATIVGGSKYYANVMVRNNPHAKITYQGTFRGTGTATFKVKRSEADKFFFTVKEEGCEEQKFTYTSRTFRGWALAGTIFGWTDTIDGVPVPWGLAVDLATGALWKPNTAENGVVKQDYKNFVYSVHYENCDNRDRDKDENSGDETQKDYPLDVVYLKNGGLMKGLIIEQIPNVQIKIQTKDGNIFVYKMEEIEKITKEFPKE